MIRHVRPRSLPLAALLVLAPLPFGSVGAAASAALLVAALSAFGLTLWIREEDGAAPPIGRELALAASALAAIAILGWMQSLPLPQAIAETLSGEAVRLGQEGRLSAGPRPGSSGESAPDFTLSLAPAASRAAALDWMLPTVTFLAAARIGGSRRVRRVLGGALLAGAAVQLAIGFAQWITRSSTLWGVTLGSISRMRGSFVNPNHLAMFLAIALTVATAWLGWSLRRSLIEGGEVERRLIAIGPAAFLCLALLGSLVVTGSRGALLAAVIAMAVQGMVVGSRRGRRWLLAGGLAAGLSGVIALAALGAEGTLARLAASSLDDASGGYRVAAARASFELFARFPFVGSGLGTFQAAFPLVQPESAPGFWRHAHSDWIELLATTGVVGFALLLAGLALYARRLRRVIRHGQRSEDRFAGVAALGALVAVAIHSCVDFGLTIPANAFALAVVAGAAGATRVGEKRRSGE